MTCHPRQPSVTRRMVVVSSVIIALAHTRGAHSTAHTTHIVDPKSPALLYLTEWLVFRPSKASFFLLLLKKKIIVFLFIISSTWLFDFETGQKKKKKKKIILEKDQISAAVALHSSACLARETNRYWKWLGPVGRGAEPSHFSLPAFRDVHLGSQGRDYGRSVSGGLERERERKKER